MKRGSAFFIFLGLFLAGCNRNSSTDQARDLFREAVAAGKSADQDDRWYISVGSRRHKPRTAH